MTKKLTLSVPHRKPRSALWTRILWREEKPQYQQLLRQHWENVAEIPATSLFSKVVLLLPSKNCSFRQRHFPLHLVAEQELAEAIELDVKQWSPWREQTQYFFSHQRVQENWQVNIWLWDLQYAQTLRQQIPQITHVMPELAWYAGCVSTPALLIHPEENASYYALVSHGWVEKMAQVHQSAQAERYWHGWGTPTISHCFTTQTAENIWHPTAHTPELLSATALPHSRLLKLTRVPGVRDWTEPASYRAVLGLLIVGLIFWMCSDAAILIYQQTQLTSQLAEISHSANEALTLRQKVKDRQQLFQQIQTLRYTQQIPEYLIAQLSEKVPNDIWLNTFQLQEGQLDISGRGKQVVRLLPLFEQIKGVKQVMLLNDVHPDPANGEEVFQIRLMLNVQL